jgi:hypothetical protein
MCAIQRVNDPSAFERGIVLGVRYTGLSVSGTAALLGFSRSTPVSMSTVKRRL